MVSGIGVVTERVSEEAKHQAALTIAEMTEEHGASKAEGLEILRMLGLVDPEEDCLMCESGEVCPVHLEGTNG